MQYQMHRTIAAHTALQHRIIYRGRCKLLIKIAIAAALAYPYRNGSISLCKIYPKSILKPSYCIAARRTQILHHKKGAVCPGCSIGNGAQRRTLSYQLTLSIIPVKGSA